MLLSEMVQEDLVTTELRARNKWDAIEELIDLLVITHELRVVNRAEVLEAVIARERTLSTGLEHGLAVPHGAVECVIDLLAVIGISHEGIPFDSLDGNPARLIVLLVIPKGAFRAQVSTLAGVARLARSKESRERIIAARTPREVMEAIYEIERPDREGRERSLPLSDE